MNKSDEGGLPDATHRRRSAHLAQDEWLYNEVLDAVVARRLNPGVKLKEDELSDIFGVSRTVVRRALLRLASDRIVDIKLNRGASVIRPDTQLAREVLSARRLIEVAVVREATRVASAEALESLKRSVELAQGELKHRGPDCGLRLSGDFHIQLAVVSGNGTLLRFLQSLVPQTSLIIAVFETPGNPHCSYEDHAAIIEAIASGNARKAEKCMEQHLEHIEAKLDLDHDRSADNLREAFAHLAAARQC